jgi:hypothetical protein
MWNPTSPAPTMTILRRLLLSRKFPAQPAVGRPTAPACSAKIPRSNLGKASASFFHIYLFFMENTMNFSALAYSQKILSQLQ